MRVSELMDGQGYRRRDVGVDVSSVIEIENGNEMCSQIQSLREKASVAGYASGVDVYGARNLVDWEAQSRTV